MAGGDSRFERYVAIGDSSTEGLDDPDGQGGYRGWANRLAEHLAAAQGSLLYANLGVRGRLTRQIRDEQLGPALAMAPDLVTVFAGTNDAVQGGFDPRGVADDLHHLQAALVASGATVLTFTMPDLAAVMPVARWVVPRVRALNETIREVAEASGARVVDFEAHPVAADLRLWSPDRFHANSAGHARMAAALAAALEVPGHDGEWRRPLPPLPPARRGEALIAELRWAWRYLLPWAWRHLWGRSSGDGRGPKRPRLTPVTAGALRLARPAAASTRRRGRSPSPGP